MGRRAGTPAGRHRPRDGMCKKATRARLPWRVRSSTAALSGSFTLNGYRHMRHLRLLRLAAVALCVAGCKENASRTASGVAFERAVPPEPTAAPLRMADTAVGIASAKQARRTTSVATAASTDPTMLIRTGDAAIEVANVDSAMARVRGIATSVGGYVTDVSLVGGRDQVRSATLTVKVPAPRYEQAVRLLQSLGTVESVQTQVQDVGEEFVDVTARMDNDRRLEQRLLDLLAKRTGKLEDVLNVERELARVRGEIEQYQGRLRYLSARAAMSTLTVTVHERTPLVAGIGARNPLATAFSQAWRNFVGFVTWFISALGILVPVGALLALAVYLVQLGRRWLARSAA